MAIGCFTIQRNNGIIKKASIQPPLRRMEGGGAICFSDHNNYFSEFLRNKKTISREICPRGVGIRVNN